MQFPSDTSHQLSIQCDSFDPNTPNIFQKIQQQQQQFLNQYDTNQKYLYNFIIGKKIGSGTFSKVCIAKHKISYQDVAIKIIQKNKIINDADKTRLNREIKIMRKVRHPNIIQLYQIIQTNKHIYLVMQYASHGQLFQHIVTHQKLTQLQSSKFLLQLLDAIQYLKQLGISHRDLKPQNLLLDHKFNIKVTDFGLSNIYPSGNLLNTACGSPSYACPEMLCGKPYDGLKADIWSLGIVLYAMCFGYLPFDNPNMNQLYKQIKQGKFDIPQTASTHLSSILYRILQVDPIQRANIDEIRNHQFCKFSTPWTTSSVGNAIPGIIVGLSDIPFQPYIQQQMKQQLNLNTDNLQSQIKNNKHNQNTCIYYLLLQRTLRNQNKSLTNYYLSKYNTINRFALIQKVKANYDKWQQSRTQIKKYNPIQQPHKLPKKSNSPHTDPQKQNKISSSDKKSISPKTILKQRYKNPDCNSSGKITHSTHHRQKFKLIQTKRSRQNRQNLSDDEPLHLQKYHNNLLKHKNQPLLMTDSKINPKHQKKLPSKNSKTKPKPSQKKPSNLYPLPSSLHHSKPPKKFYSPPKTTSHTKYNKTSHKKSDKSKSNSSKKNHKFHQFKQLSQPKFIYTRNQSLTQSNKLKF